MSSMRNPSAQAARLHAEELESRSTPAVTLRLDYSFDQSGFFNDPARRQIIQQLADQIGSRLDDNLAAIAPSGNNTWDASFFNPVTNSTTVLNNPTIGANELLVYVAAAPIGADELGLTTTGGFSASGSRPWLETVRARGQAGALTDVKTDYSTWGGMITFDSRANWSFASGGPASTQYDFATVATHELLHVFGFGLGEAAFTRNVTGWNGLSGQFNGPSVVATMGSSVTVTGDEGYPDHWAPGTTVGGQQSPMQPTLMMGQRRLITELEFAALNDIGWNVQGVAGPPRTTTTTAVDTGTVTTASETHQSASALTASTTPNLSARRFAVGTSTGVNVYGTSGQLVTTSRPLNPGTNSSTRVALVDVNGDGVPDLIAGSGPGVAPLVTITDGVTGAQLASIQPFEVTFLGGVNVAAGDITRDGRAEVVVTPDQGGGPVVAIYDGASLAAGRTVQLARFFGINDSNFRGGARAGLGDLNADGTPDLIISAGYGGGPRIAVYDGVAARSNRASALIGDFFAFEQSLRNGAYVTSADLDSDGYADVIVGAGPGGGPRVTVYSGKELLVNRRTISADFFAGLTTLRGGIRVAATDVDNDGKPDIVTGSGTGGQVSVYLAVDGFRGTPQSRINFTIAGNDTDGLYVA